MTLGQLLEMEPEVLEKMTDAELLEHFKPYLEVTRPERARLAKPKTQHEPTPYLSHGKKKALNALGAMGIDMGDLFKKKGKR